MEFDEYVVNGKEYEAEFVLDKDYKIISAKVEAEY